MRDRKSQANAIALRRQPTDAEHRLWQRLRLRQVNGWKFRRQYPIGSFVADFACLEASLIIEVDGGQHNESAHDVARDGWLKRNGFRVLRFWNTEVLREVDSVLETIAHELGEQPGRRPHPSRPHPNPPPQAGEGTRAPRPPQAGEGTNKS